MGTGLGCVGERGSDWGIVRDVSDRRWGWVVVPDLGLGSVGEGEGAGGKGEINIVSKKYFFSRLFGQI